MDEPSVWFNLISLAPVDLVSARATLPIGVLGDTQHAWLQLVLSFSDWLKTIQIGAFHYGPARF